MVKLICIDLDGTLLQKHYLISKENMDAVRFAVDNGVLVGVNTGRNSTSAVYFSEIAGMNAPVVCCGGSLILGEGAGVPRKPEHLLSEVSGRAVLMESVLSGETLKKAWEIASRLGISFYAHGKNAYYIVGEKEQNEFVMDWDKKAISIIDMGLMHFKSFDEFMAHSGGRVVKMGFSSMDEGVLMEVSRHMQGDCRQTFALGCILEITRENANKGSAVEFLANYYGFNKDEIACIGDDTNDIAMFKACGRSVAVGDGCDEVKELAEYVADTCENSGVAEGIYYLLGEGKWKR